MRMHLHHGQNQNVHLTLAGEATTSSTSSAPVRTLFLPDGGAVIATIRTETEVNLSGQTENLRLGGIFAASLIRQLSGRPDGSDHQRLHFLEQQHTWLAGLSHATLQAPESLRPLLIGNELGMLFIELTARCNERCIHCYAESTPERDEFLATSEVIGALDEARELGRSFVQFTGGDPLIHRDLAEIIAHAHHLDFEGIEIYTNGLLLHDKLLAQLSPYRPRIAFSIYADTAEVHDAITQLPGSWQRTLDAMERARNAGFVIRAGIVLMQENIACAERMNDFLHQHLGLAPSDIHYDAVNAVGRAHLQGLATDIKIIPSHAPASASPHRGKLCLAANGDIHPCIFARDIRIGNIRQQPLKQVIDSLDHREPASPSDERWNSCVKRLSCPDCRITAYTLGDSAS